MARSKLRNLLWLSNCGTIFSPSARPSSTSLFERFADLIVLSNSNKKKVVMLGRRGVVYVTTTPRSDQRRREEDKKIDVSKINEFIKFLLPLSLHITRLRFYFLSLVLPTVALYSANTNNANGAHAKLHLLLSANATIKTKTIKSSSLRLRCH